MVVVHRLLQPTLKKINLFRKHVPDLLCRLLKIIVFFQLVSLGLTIFRSQSVAHMWKLFKILLSFQGVADISLLIPLLQFVAPLHLLELVQYSLSRDDWGRIQQIPVWTRTIVYAAMFYLIAFHGAAAQSFIYFQF